MTEAAPRRVLYDADTIGRRVRELGRAISEDYRDRPLVLLCVLKGSFVFAADLLRAIGAPVRVEFLAVRSYGDATRSSGVVQITQDLTRPITGEDVLVVEDIVDTGLTCHYLCEQLLARGARSVQVCALLHKPARQRRRVEIAYLGFTIDDVFVVGYGLDHAERFRQLPELVVIEDEGA